MESRNINLAKGRVKTYSSRELMELAVAEGELSIPEHNDKEDPFVGAIVATKEGEILEKAHRGELRQGEHCEFTLLERKLRDKNLVDCVLYVTLEPCTDGARTGTTGKRGCATHIVRSRIGTVYVGIEDPNPKIANQGTRYLIANRLVVHPFDVDLQERIRKRNAKFIHEKEEEAKALQPDETAIKIFEEEGFLEHAKPGASFGGLSDELLQKFVKFSKLPHNYPSHDFNLWATDFGLLERDEGTGNYRPTGLGMMLFGKQPSTLYPQVVFKIEVNYGKGEPEIRDVVTPLVSQWPEILEYVKDKALKLTIDRSGKERGEVPDFPIDVIREAVVNAIIHRDYGIEGATNYLYIDSEKIIVRSPGNVAPPISLEDLKEFKASPHSRNPKIMYVFNQMKFAEQRGKGMRSMKELPTLGFPLPAFETLGGSLIVSFARNSNSIRKEGMSEQEYLELLYIQGHEPITRVQFAKHFQLPDRTAKAHLENLVDSRKIKTVGRGKATKYVSSKS